MESALGLTANIVVSLPTGKLFKADLSKELVIDTSNIVSEILGQPAKYAWWSALSDLSRYKVEDLNTRLGDIAINDERYLAEVEKYNKMQQQCELLTQAKEAFNHRKATLINLLTNPKEEHKELQKYHRKLEELRALIQDSESDKSPQTIRRNA